MSVNERRRRGEPTDLLEGHHGPTHDGPLGSLAAREELGMEPTTLRLLDHPVDGTRPAGVEEVTPLPALASLESLEDLAQERAHHEGSDLLLGRAQHEAVGAVPGELTLRDLVAGIQIERGHDGDRVRDPEEERQAAFDHGGDVGIQAREHLGRLLRAIGSIDHGRPSRIILIRAELPHSAENLLRLASLEGREFEFFGVRERFIRAGIHLEFSSIRLFSGLTSTYCDMCGSAALTTWEIPRP